MDSEIEELPTDYVRGLDFKIAKTSKGGYADYTTSNWSRRERALSEAENEAIAKHGLFDLKTFLPKKPTDVELKVIKEMFEASVDGQPYDPDRWANYYKPSGFKGGSGVDADALPEAKPVAQTKPAVAAVAPAPMEDEDDTPVASAPVVTPVEAKPSTQKAEDILAMIRNRKSTT